MSEPLLDLDRLVAGLRFRRRMWFSFAVLGLVAGVLMTLLTPSGGSAAVARVLIARADDRSSDREALMATDIALFETTVVAGEALQKLGVDGSAAGFLGSYDGEALTPNILQITVRATTDAEAVRRAEALVATFLESHVGRARDVAEGQATVLGERRAQVEQAVQEVDTTILQTAAQGSGAAADSRQAADISAELDGLYARRAGLASQIQALDTQAEEARLAAALVTVGTQVVDPPRAVPISSGTGWLTNGAVGLVLGLGIGLALAAVLTVARDRPTLRRDIAAGLGVSVLAQLPASRRRLLWRGRRARERERVAAALATCMTRVPKSASLLEIGCPRTAAELAVDLAEQLAAKRSLVIVDDLGDGRLKRAAERAGLPSEIVDRVDLPSAPALPSPMPRLHLGVGSITPGSSWVDLRELGTEAVLVIRAGGATTDWLHTVARQLDHAGICPIGVVLVQPHPGDRSDGALWHRLHAALNGRRASVTPPGAFGGKHLQTTAIRIGRPSPSPHE